MLRLSVNASALLNWARYLEQIPIKSKAAVARALNAYGAGVARRVAQYMADAADLSLDAVLANIVVKEATPDDWTWEMDATQVAPPSLDWSRPWEKRDDKTFEKDILVKIVTMGDDKVCEKCEDLEEHSPWTLGEAQERLPAHVNCRCVVQSWSSLRRLPVTFGSRRSGGPPPELFTTRQLGEAVAGELRVAIRAN